MEEKEIYISKQQLKKWAEEMGETQDNRFEEIFAKHLGISGRMICGSKSFYSKSYPKNVVIFNANICSKEQGKLWHGDIDVTRDEDALKTLASELKTTLYLFYEMDARFENSKNVDFDKAVFVVGETITPTTKINEFVKRWKNTWRLKR